MSKTNDQKTRIRLGRHIYAAIISITIATYAATFFVGAAAASGGSYSLLCAWAWEAPPFNPIDEPHGDAATQCSEEERIYWDQHTTITAGKPGGEQHVIYECTDPAGHGAMLSPPLSQEGNQQRPTVGTLYQVDPCGAPHPGMQIWLTPTFGTCANSCNQAWCYAAGLMDCWISPEGGENTPYSVTHAIGGTSSGYATAPTISLADFILNDLSVPMVNVTTGLTEDAYEASGSFLDIGPTSYYIAFHGAMSHKATATLGRAYSNFRHGSAWNVEYLVVCSTCGYVLAGNWDASDGLEDGDCAVLMNHPGEQ